MPTLPRFRIAAVALLWLVPAVATDPSDAAGQIVRPGATSTALDSSVVTVTGTGTRLVRPDGAIVMLQVVSKGASPEAAALENGERLAAVRDALEGLGYPEESISLWGLGSGTAGPTYGPPEPGAGAGPYETRSGLRVVAGSLERLDVTVSSALLAGASLARVELTSVESDTALEAASADAVRQARSMAEAMAEAAGGRLGPVLNITSLTTSGLDGSWMTYGPQQREDVVALAPTETVVRATVQVTWAYEPR